MGTGTIKISQIDPSTSLGFWLGGITDANGKPIGFSANPTDPFDETTTATTRCANRIGPFFDFNPTRMGVKWGKNNVNWYRYWPVGATGTNQYCSYVYFRAENGNYTTNGLPTGTIKTFGDIVYPAADWRLATASPYSWINPASFQIFCAGMDVDYGLANHGTSGTDKGPLRFPLGGNYQPVNFDDITNFSNGTLEDAIP